MSSPPLSEPGHRAGLFFERPVCSRAGSSWPQALVQDSQAVPREELRLGDLAILSRPEVARGERIGGGPVHHAWLTELERLAGPSVPCLVMPHLVSNLTPAFQGVPSGAAVRTDLTAPRSPHAWLPQFARNWLRSPARQHPWVRAAADELTVASWIVFDAPIEDAREVDQDNVDHFWSGTMKYRHQSHGAAWVNDSHRERHVARRTSRTRNTSGR